MRSSLFRRRGSDASEREPLLVAEAIAGPSRGFEDEVLDCSIDYLPNL